ncbi:hypothetical protein [Streptomyces sp. WP-1]|uniref:hypothetical protein n=1 Tax=Streptomyces sp. WP-1 TaxID=3041497 RepID=UPI0026494490|nr:hypothetical protein [Streptomyces sp. WP-1]WKE71841.1 hypothetical protein QHG49_23935 [Streptomyces sp. WP-1]
MPGSHRPSTGLLGYAAFVQLHRRDYEMYAGARLGDSKLAMSVVADVLRRAELSWNTLMLRENPLALTWRALRDSVTTARTETHESRTDGLHRALPDQAADAVLLREKLGMDTKAAAALMGLEEPELHMQFQAARRMLAGPGHGR